MQNLWVRGICDKMLLRVLFWQQHWPHGKEAADRLFLHRDGRQEHIVTKRAVKVPFHPREFEAMVRIVTTLRPDWEFGIDLKAFFEKGQFEKSELLPQGNRLVTLISYQADIGDILDILTQAKQGIAPLGSELNSGSFWNNLTEGKTCRP